MSFIKKERVVLCEGGYEIVLRSEDLQQTYTMYHPATITETYFLFLALLNILFLFFFKYSLEETLLYSQQYSDALAMTPAEYEPSSCCHLHSPNKANFSKLF